MLRALSLFVLAACSATAAVPDRLQVIGKLGPAAGDTGGGHDQLANMRVTIEDLLGASLYVELGCGVAVHGNDGEFEICLGELDPIALPFDQQYRVKVEACLDRLGCAGELDVDACPVRDYVSETFMPCPVAYAQRARDTDTFGGLSPGDFLTVDTIFDGDVTGPANDLQLKVGVVGSAELGNDSVTSNKIADGSVTSADIQDGTVNSADLQDGGVGNADLANNAVDSAKIADGSVASADIADGTVASADLLDGGVANADLANNSVDANKIVNDTITGTDVATASVPLSDLAQSGASSGQVAEWNGASWVPSTDDTAPTGAAGGDLTGTYPNPQIAANAVNSAKVADGTLASADVQDGTIVAADVNSSSVQVRVAGNCPVDQSIRVVNADGTVVCEPDTADTLWTRSGTFTSLVNSGDFVGIGTPTPLSKLDVLDTNFIVGRLRSSSTVGTWLTLQNTGGGQDWELLSTGSSNTEGAGEFLVKQGLAGPIRLDIEPNGEVGIGTFNPDALLHVQGNACFGGSPRNGAFFDVTGRGAFGDIFGFSNHMLSSRVTTGNAAIDVALFGSNEGTTGFETGVYGRTTSLAGFGVFSEGNFGASGTKAFLQPHPTDPSKNIRFVSLEGNESGTYFRTKERISGGRAVIDVPADFRMATEADGLSVQLTTVGDARAWIESYDLDRIVVGGTADVEVHVLVNGVRRGFGGIETIVDNHAFVPVYRDEPFGTAYPQAVRDILVANGILHADYTPDEETAAKMGWTLRDRADDAAVKAEPPADPRRR